MADKLSTAEDFQKIAEILLAIKNTINSKTDIVCTRFDSIEELLMDLDNKIARLQLYDNEIPGDLSMMFAPTGAYQELSISNGWGEYYIELAGRFDYHFKKIRSAAN